MHREKYWSKFVQILEKSFPLILFLVAFLPRANHLVARSIVWHYRAIEFIEAIMAADFGQTLQAPHPGVITMWLAGLAHWLANTVYSRFDRLPLDQQMTIELIPLAMVISLLIVLAYFQLTRIFDRQVAAIATLLLALDPFNIFISKPLQVDALMSVFVMTSVLFIFLYISLTGRGRSLYISLSGFFAGLALLSKTPALFLIPYLFLCLGVWTLLELRANGNKTGFKISGWRALIKPTMNQGKAVGIWLLFMLITYSILWPSMWVQPLDTLDQSFGKSLFYAETPHSKEILFLGETTTEDPGPLFYPVHLTIKTTMITLPFFLISLVFLFDRKIERHQRLVLGLMFAFVFFFMFQMTLGDKKIARYILPAAAFVVLVAGFGAVHFFRWLARGRRWFLNLSLFLVVAAQFAIAIPRHPYYGTHFNRFFGSPKTILDKGVIPGQDQGEGLDIAAEYLNSLPLSQLLVASAQIPVSFGRYFHGKTVEMTDDKVDYLVFARNRVLRAANQKVNDIDLWRAYRTRQPKFVVEFDDVPYVWVYKVGPVIDKHTFNRPLDAQFGQDIHLMGYDLGPAEIHPGETLRLILYWEAVNKPTGDYTVFTHLLGPSGELRGQQDNQPQGGMYPTYLWDQGERIQDILELKIDPDAPPGQYDLAIGMYTLENLERVPITDQHGEIAPDNRLLIPGVVVKLPDSQ
jgi:hypothetical protein